MPLVINMFSEQHPPQPYAPCIHTREKKKKKKKRIVPSKMNQSGSILILAVE